MNTQTGWSRSWILLVQAHPLRINGTRLIGSFQFMSHPPFNSGLAQRRSEVNPLEDESNAGAKTMKLIENWVLRLESPGTPRSAKDGHHFSKSSLDMLGYAGHQPTNHPKPTDQKQLSMRNQGALAHRMPRPTRTEAKESLVECEAP